MGSPESDLLTDRAGAQLIGVFFSIIFLHRKDLYPTRLLYGLDEPSIGSGAPARSRFRALGHTTKFPAKPRNKLYQPAKSGRHSGE